MNLYRHTDSKNHLFLDQLCDQQEMGIRQQCCSREVYAALLHSSGVYHAHVMAAGNDSCALHRGGRHLSDRTQILHRLLSVHRELFHPEEMGVQKHRD